MASEINSAHIGNSDESVNNHADPCKNERLGVREGVILFLAAISIRLIFLILDPLPRFFLGDSYCYLVTEWGSYIPNDRSWIFGLFINNLFRLTQSFMSLVLLQSLVSASVGAVTAIFCRTLGLRKPIAWIVLILFSIEPMLLFYDRSIMTDSLGSSFIWLAIIISFAAFFQNKLYLAFLSVIFFYGAICLRTALLPLVLLVPILLLLAAAPGQWRQLFSHIGRYELKQAVRKLLIPGILVLFVLLGLKVYSHWTGVLTNSESSLNPKGGYFLLGVFAPILAPEDFDGLGIKDPAYLLEQSWHYNYDLRNFQIYGEEGIACRLQKEMGGDWRKVSHIGSTVARRAALRNPKGCINLLLFGARDYLDLSRQKKVFPETFGFDKTFDKDVLWGITRTAWERPTSDYPSRNSIIRRWLRKNLWSFPVLALFSWILPIFSLVLCRRMNSCQCTVSWVMALCALIYANSIFFPPHL